MDPISATLMTFGVILLGISWIYLIFVSFEDDFSWGLCAIFLPLLAYIYACFRWNKTQASLWTAAGGWAAILLAL